MLPFDYQMDAGFEGVLLIILAIYGVVLLFALLFSVACYILSSLGVYTLAKRRGIHHPWLSWIPYGDMWILGSISDQYQYVKKGKIKNRRKVLLALSIATTALLIPIVIFTVFAAMGYQLFVVLIVLAYLALMVFAIVGSVFQYVSYYDLFSSSKPENANLFLVLGIIFPVTLPFFLFACRKCDGGMPPRKAPVPPAIAQAEEMSYEENAGNDNEEMN